MTTQMLPIIAISLGASAGALARWQLALHLNPKMAMFPLGTLLANWIGAYCVGLAMAAVAESPKMSEEWRLFIITGLLGGLTTFSTFSAEVVQLLQQGRWLWAGAEISAHVIGSILLTLIGFATYQLLR